MNLRSNKGAATARNEAAAIASGEYLAFLDADDSWVPSKLTKTVGALEHNSRAVLAFSDYIQSTMRVKIWRLPRLAMRHRCRICYRVLGLS